MARTEFKSLFPTPLMRIQDLIEPELLSALTRYVESTAQDPNAHAAGLNHSKILGADAPEPLHTFIQQVLPHIAVMGQRLFGEMLDWSVKEIWGNVLDPGSHQTVHSHSNSFVSGILYLTPSHPSANTVFHRSIGGQEFIFSNAGPNVRPGPYNSNKWISPDPEPGDIVLYPSYLLHEVPRNQGRQRMTIAFNAIPDRLNAWGYQILFDSLKGATSTSE